MPLVAATFALLLAISPSANPSTVEEPSRGIVLPVKVAAPVARLLNGDQQRRLEQDITAILRRYQGLNVLSAVEVKQLAEIDAQRQASGCDSSCASEIAAAMGARFVFALQVDVGPQGMTLVVSLIDGESGTVVSRGRAHGARFADFQPQLPFAVDDAASTLRVPGDPTPADILQAARPKLAVLPVRADPKLKAVGAIVDDAAGGESRRLGFSLMNAESFATTAKARGCVVEDLGCSLPAAAVVGAALGIGVSVRQEGPAAGTSPVVAASLLTPAGKVLASAKVVVAGGRPADLERALRESIAQVVTNKLTGLRPNEARPSSDTNATSNDTAGGNTNEGAGDVLGFACNIQRGIETVGAHCNLSAHTLEIRPHALNFQSYREVLSLRDVKRADPYAGLGLFPSGIRLFLHDGSSRDLIVGVGPRDRLLASFRERLASP